MILTIFFCSISLTTNAAYIICCNDTDSTKLVGAVVQTKKFSKRFAILMRDTTLGGNRFDNQWHKSTDQHGRISSSNCLLQALLVDSSLAVYCDSLLSSTITNDKIKLTSCSKKTAMDLTKKNIRLYIGYLDEMGEKNIVIQFVSLKEFKKRQSIYSKELFLVVPSKKLHFAVINIGK